MRSILTSILFVLLSFLIGCSAGKGTEPGKNYIKGVKENGYLVQNVSGLNTKYDEYSPFIVPSEKIIYLASTRPNGTTNKSGEEKIWYAHKEGNFFGPVVEIGSPINKKGNQTTCSFTPDGKTIFFSSDMSGGYGNYDIYYSNLYDRGWSEPVNLGANVNSPFWDAQPAISPDRNTLVFASNRESGFGGSDLYITRKDNLGTWSKPENLGALVNSSDDEFTPYFSKDGKNLFFSSDNNMSIGGLDIFVSQIIDGKFTTKRNLAEPFNSKENDFFYSQDGDTSYFASNRPYSIDGSYDIWRVSPFKEEIIRPIDTPVIKPVEKPIYVKGKVYENSPEGQKPIAAEVSIKNIDDNIIIAVIKSDETTGYYLNEIKKGKRYQIIAKAKGFRTGQDEFSVPINFSQTEYKKDIELQPQRVALTGTVSEANSKPKKYLKAKITLKDLITSKQIAEFESDPHDGHFYFILETGKNYFITANARDYLFYSSQFDLPENTPTNSVIKKDIELTPIKAKKSSVELMVFFDYNKATLRPESNSELTNAIDFLKDNPNIFVEIAGHTDKRGTDSFNNKLSTDRANAVANYIISNSNIDKKRVVAKGYGKKQLKFKGNTEEDHQRNRRVEMVIKKY